MNTKIYIGKLKIDQIVNPSQNNSNRTKRSSNNSCAASCLSRFVFLFRLRLRRWNRWLKKNSKTIQKQSKKMWVGIPKLTRIAWLLKWAWKDLSACAAASRAMRFSISASAFSRENASKPWFKINSFSGWFTLLFSRTVLAFFMNWFVSSFVGLSNELYSSNFEFFF